MGNMPAFYDYINAYNSSFSPSTVHCKNTSLVRYFAENLLTRAMSVFKFSCPETWSKRYYMYSLYTTGFVVVYRDEKFGVIPQACTLSGYNVFYEPTTPIIANPLIVNPPDLRIDQNCTIIKLFPSYKGIMDIVNYYADMLGLCSEMTAGNLINSKLSYVFTAANKPQAESFKKMFDSIASGEPCVVIDTSIAKSEDATPAWNSFTQDLRSNFIAPESFDCIRSILNNFDTDIGIRNSNVDKKAQVNNDEINANNEETLSLAWQMYESLKEGIDKTRKMFGESVNPLSVAWRYPPNPQRAVENSKGVAQNGDTFNSRSVSV